MGDTYYILTTHTGRVRCAPLLNPIIVDGEESFNSVEGAVAACLRMMLPCSPNDRNICMMNLLKSLEELVADRLKVDKTYYIVYPCGMIATSDDGKCTVPGYSAHDNLGDALLQVLSTAHDLPPTMETQSIEKAIACVKVIRAIQARHKRLTEEKPVKYQVWGIADWTSRRCLEEGVKDQSDAYDTKREAENYMAIMGMGYPHCHIWIKEVDA